MAIPVIDLVGLLPNWLKFFLFLCIALSGVLLINVAFGFADLVPGVDMQSVFTLHPSNAPFECTTSNITATAQSCISPFGHDVINSFDRCEANYARWFNCNVSDYVISWSVKRNTQYNISANYTLVAGPFPNHEFRFVWEEITNPAKAVNTQVCDAAMFGCWTTAQLTIYGFPDEAGFTDRGANCTEDTFMRMTAAQAACRAKGLYLLDPVLWSLLTLIAGGLDIAGYVTGFWR
jgi:hypothetical protein